MAKTNITQYSSTPSSNTDINNINIDENCPASGLNNAIRELMAHLKNVDTGSQALTALSVTGAFSCGALTSNGIDDNASSTSVTIDSSQRFMVGKTSTGLANVGAELDPTGQLKGTASNVVVQYLNRTTSDGTIAEFRKDNTTVGAIASRAGSVSTIILDPSATGGGISGGGSALYPTDHAGTLSDGALTLGDASYRWNNLYLSGGVYLGGTGSANYLDDYEEGSFTPTFGGSGGNQTVSYAFQFGTYVKVGKLVFVNISVGATGTPSGGSGDLIIANLPFNSKSGVQQAGSMAFANNISFGSSGTQGYCNIEGNVNYLNINSQELVGTSSMSRVPASGIHNTDPRIVCTICYETA